MLIENEQNSLTKLMSAHGGDGQISMRFFHKNLQNYSERLDNNDTKNPDNNSLWNFFAIAELEEGSSVKRHLHKQTDEIYYILEGTAEITVDDETQEIGAGDVILTKAGSYHSIQNVKRTFKFIAIEVLTDGY